MQHVVAASAQIEAQLKILDGTFPVLVMLHKAKAEAADAMTMLATCEFSTPIEDIRHWQNEIRRFDDLVRWLLDIVEEGKRYDAEITQEERDALANMLLQSPDGERVAREVGLINERDFE